MTDPQVEVVDAHVHLWDLGRRPQPWIDPRTMSAIHRDFDLDDLVRETAAAGVTECVLVQVLNIEDETRDYLTVAHSSTAICGVVGWVDLAAADLPSRLVEQRRQPGGAKLVGIRHQAQAESEPGAWLRTVAARGGLEALANAGLVCDLMMRPEQLGDVLTVARSHPEVTFVLDHAGKPPVASGWTAPESRSWATRIAALAPLTHVVGKLSGLTTMADPSGWSVADLRPYVDHLLTCFGPSRLMFGSDWPVSLRAGSYVRTVETAIELLADLAASERSQVMAVTARRVYGLGLVRR